MLYIVSAVDSGSNLDSGFESRFRFRFGVFEAMENITHHYKTDAFHFEFSDL